MLAILLVLGAMGALFAVVYSPAFVGASAAERQLPVYSVGRDGKYCALSFDAAWGNEDTPELIRILGSYGVKATFFVVGDWVRKYPESVKALAEAGHEVMNHSNHHDHFNPLSTQQITDDVSACAEEIEGVTGVRPKLSLRGVRRSCDRGGEQPGDHGGAVGCGQSGLEGSRCGDDP